MRGDTICVQVRRRANQENVLLLRPREEIFGLQNFADCRGLGFNHIRPQRLGAENVRDKTKSIQKEGERRETLGPSFYGEHVRSAGTPNVCADGSWRHFADGGNRLQLEIAEWTQPSRQSAKEAGQTRYHHGFQDGFVVDLVASEFSDISPGEPGGACGQLAGEIQQGLIGYRQVGPMMIDDDLV